MTTTEKQLMAFLESLNNRGLLSKPLEEFDYEWVIWDYLRPKEPIIDIHAEKPEGLRWDIFTEKDSTKYPC